MDPRVRGPRPVSGLHLIFFPIAEDVPEAGRMVRTDAAITSWLQSHGTEWGESIFVDVSYLGAQALIATLVLIAAVLIVRRDWSRLKLLIVACLGSAILNAALKAVFQRSRPEFAAEFDQTSWSFPSAHAMNSLVVYGLLAYWLAQRIDRARHWIFVGTVVLVAAIGYARIYLGVHYLSDVIAGYAAGATWLAVCITGSQFAKRRGMT